MSVIKRDKSASKYNQDGSNNNTNENENNQVAPKSAA